MLENEKSRPVIRPLRMTIPSSLTAIIDRALPVHQIYKFKVKDIINEMVC
jgi:hypothetical protein